MIINKQKEPVMALCRKCNNSVPAESLKMDLDEGIMVCSACIHNKQIKKDTVELKKNSTTAVSKTTTSTEIPNEKRKYICEGCKYRFIVDFDKEYPKVCPYCSRPVRFK